MNIIALILSYLLYYFIRVGAIYIFLRFAFKPILKIDLDKKSILATAYIGGLLSFAVWINTSVSGKGDWQVIGMMVDHLLTGAAGFALLYSWKLRTFNQGRISFMEAIKLSFVQHLIGFLFFLGFATALYLLMHH